ncbi:hypothetical protein CCYA_CCYA06G1770 [Cyanidiococcus yangmingshanensis]|nr:hypothetical protein CCYA_CCYA06G1770 [Cyanidiococcus yangmingshanensis]
MPASVKQIGLGFRRVIIRFFGTIDKALFIITGWVSPDPVIKESIFGDAAQLDGGNLFVVTLDDGLRRAPREIPPLMTQNQVEQPSFSSVTSAEAKNERKNAHAPASAKDSRTRKEQASEPQRRQSIFAGLQRMLTRRGSIALQASSDLDGLQRTLTFADTKRWVEELKQLYASRISFPRHKYEVFRPSQLNFLVSTLWVLVIVTGLLAVAAIVYTNVTRSDFFLYSPAFLYVASIGGLIESAICLALYLFFTTRVFTIPAEERTRMQCVIAAMTFVLFWQTEPLTVVLKLVDSAKLVTRVPRVVVAFQLIGNLAFYIGTLGFLLVVCHLYRIRETYRINWFIFLFPKVLVIGALLGLSFVLFFVGRVMPARLPLVALINIVRAGRMTGVWDYDTASIVAVLSFWELFITMVIVYEIRGTWESLNKESYSISRSRQLGFRLFLYTTTVAYVSLWVIVVLAVSLIPGGLNIAYYYIALAQNRLPAFYFTNSQVNYFLDSIFFDPLFSSSVYFVLNTIVIAVLICNVLMYLPPETPKFLAKIACCLATSRSDMFSQYVCCRDEPKPFFRWGRQNHVSASPTPPRGNVLAASEGSTVDNQTGGETESLHNSSSSLSLQQGNSELSGSASRNANHAASHGNNGTVGTQCEVSLKNNALSTSGAVHAATGSRTSARTIPAPKLSVPVPIMRRYVFCIETMVEQFNLSWAAYMFDPTNPSPEHIQSERFWKESLRIFYHGETDTLGFLVETEDRIAVSFRGTRSRKNLQTDMHTRLVPLQFPNEETDAAVADRLLRCGSFYSNPRETLNAFARLSDTASRVQRYLHIRSKKSRPRVHEGFLTSYLSIYQEVELEVTRRYKSNPRPILISGHSLGGALANLAALHLAIRLELNDTSMMLTTFGSPRVGDLYFARLLDFMVPIHFRVTNAADAVARLPFTGLGGWFAWGASAYAHAGIQVLLNKHGLLRVDPSIVELEFQFRVGAYIAPHLKRGYRRSMEAWAERSCPDGWRPDFWTFTKMVRACSKARREGHIVHDEHLTDMEQATIAETSEELNPEDTVNEALEENMDILADETNIRDLVRGMTFAIRPGKWS